MSSNPANDMDPISADAAAAAAKQQLPSPVTDKSLHLENENEGLSDTVSQRLTRLANLSLSENHPNGSNYDLQIIYQCLDTLESILDPRPNFTKEITLCRSPTTEHGTKSTSPRNSIIDKGASPPPSESRNTDNNNSDNRLPPPESKSTSSQQNGFSGVFKNAKMVEEELKMVSEELLIRNEETLQALRVINQERKQREGRIIELESEIDELRADVQEEMAEREALQGTVHGLKAWVDGWPKEPQQTRSGGGWWSKKKVEKLGKFDAEALFDGMAAWMRGWSDVEEEFRYRDEARRRRRENNKNKR
ncbi:hypothetical protein BDV06DRAFT_69025 [Aspergillus oleicola]